MQLKKLSLMVVGVVMMGAAFSGCSLKEKLPGMMNAGGDAPEVSSAPAAMDPKTDATTETPMPTQSSSSEVMDLELDLKTVKFDQESFE